MSIPLVLLLLTAVLHGCSSQESNLVEDENASQETTPVYVEAVITTQPATIMVQSGHEIRLPCVVQYLVESNGVVIWKKAAQGEEGEQFLANGGRKISRNPVVALEGETLVIKRASEKDAGDYICQVAQEKSVEVRHTVVISRPPTADIQPNEPSREVSKGEPYDLSCMTKGFPQPTIRWFLKADEAAERAELAQFFNQSTVHLPSLQRANAGEYVCEATNDVGDPATASHKILLRYQPELLQATPAMFLSKVGGEAKLECSFSAYPVRQGSIVWHKLARPPMMITPPPVTIQMVDVSVTEAAVDVDEQVSTDPTVPSESDMETTDAPPLEGQNKRDAGDEKEPVQNGDRHALTETNAGNTMHSSLLITNVGEEDFRKYVCTAKNEMGSAEQTIELSGLPYPVAVQPAKLAMHEPLKYAVDWQVRSSSPIKEYRIIYREFNETHQGSELNLTVPEDDKEAQPESGDVKLYRKTYVFENLRPWTNYTVQIGAHNDYGWSNERDLQHQFFMTDSISSPQTGSNSASTVGSNLPTTLATAVFLFSTAASWRRYP